MKDRRKFTEGELWYLMYGMVNAREALVMQGKQLGDLQPRNVFLNANQQVKLGNVFSWPRFISGYRKAVTE